MSRPPRANDRPPGGKATLFCTDCDHASGIDGDWIRRETSREVLVCPECGAEVIAQPNLEMTA